ncbi:MAG: hypothetical protein JOZ54_02820 [Acidobacteria bacterium]|nr:hypothetical protein [Acidobacteriota bacterium]
MHLMRGDLPEVRSFADDIERALPAALNQIRANHPLLHHATLATGSRLAIPADIHAEQPTIATYELPALSSGVALDVDSTVTTIDRLSESTTAIIGYIAFEYERDIRSGLYVPDNGFLGIAGLLPANVGANVVAGISEASAPGWRSQVTQTRPNMYEAFVTSEARCFAGGKAPDLTILGTDAYHALVMNIQPQQRFTTVRAGFSMLQLHAGGLFHDPFCHADGGYMLHTADFQFHASPFDPIADIGIDGQIRIHVRRREQITTNRRYRSGMIAPASEGLPAWLRRIR